MISILKDLPQSLTVRYRQQFEKQFDFLAFNKELVLSSGSGRYAIAFDPSYISKAGKKTPGVNWYWSGCANQAKWGLEIGGLAAIDIDNHIAFHLEAVQTLKTDEQSLTNWYADVISARKDTLTAISKYMVADAWFSKRTFVDPIASMGMHLISRLRDDADLRYISAEKPTGKRGRPSKYSGKIILNDIDKDYSTFKSQDEESTVYSAEVYSKALKRIINAGCHLWEGFIEDIILINLLVKLTELHFPLKIFNKSNSICVSSQY